MTGVLTHLERDDLDGLRRELETGPHSRDDLAFAVERATHLDRAAHLELLARAGGDSAGRTPMEWAEDSGVEEISRLLSGADSRPGR